MHDRRTQRAAVLRVRGSIATEERDDLAREEPMEIRVAGPNEEEAPLVVTMRTPGHDVELAAGFLFTEGIIDRRRDLLAIEEGAPMPGDRARLPIAGRDANVVRARIAKAIDAERTARSFFATSSCGVCGKASIDQIEVRAGRVTSSLRAGRALITSLPGALRAAQEVFAKTGGLHATGVFDEAGALLIAREDVGRHNAMDKVVGRLFLDDRLPIERAIIAVSGRLSFELVQKIARAGAPIACAVSAPSSLAIEAADRLGVTLVGFVRGESFNVYTHTDRIDRGQSA